MLGVCPRSFAPTTMPRIPSSRLTANAISVTKSVTSTTRSGIRYQRSLYSGVLCAAIPLQTTTFRPDYAVSQAQCVRIAFMSQAAPAMTRPPAEVVRQNPVSQAANGICYALSGEVTISEADVARMVAAVPDAGAAALHRKAYYFVPLTVNHGDETVIADR